MKRLVFNNYPRLYFLICFWIINFLFNQKEVFGQTCTLNLGNDFAICSGSELVIANPTGGVGTPTYSWSLDNVIQTNSSSSFSVSFSSANNPQVVSCTVAYSNGCTTTDDINVYSINGGVISAVQYTCAGSAPNQINSTNSGTTSITGISSIISNYQWESSNSSSGPWTPISGATNETYSPSTISTLTYYRRQISVSFNGLNFNCYSNVVSIDVIGAPSISNNQCLAIGSTANLNIQFATNLPTGITASYAWSGPSSFNSNIANPSVSNFSSNKAGTYNAVVTLNQNNSSLCTFNLNTQLNLNPTTPTFTLPTNGCPTSSYTPGSFSAQSGFTYLWTTDPVSNSTGLNTSSPSFIFNSGGSYSVSVAATNSNGCTSTSLPVSISIMDLSMDAPTVTIGSTNYNQQTPNGPIAICTGLSVTSVTIINNSASIWGTNPVGTTYTYSFNNSTPVAITNQTNQTIYYGDNFVTLTANYQGCSVSNTVNVYSGSNPFVSLGTSNSIGLCQGESANFTINPIPTSGQLNPPGTTYTVTYSEAPGTSNVFSNLTTLTNVTHVYNSSSCGTTYPGNLYPANTFYATVTAQNFCGQTSSTVSPITVNNYPIANFTVTDSTICAGQSITVTNTGTAGNVSGSTTPYSCSGQGKFYWTISGGTSGVDYTVTGTLGGYNGNYILSNGLPNTIGNGSNTLQIAFINPGYYTVTQHYYNTCGTKTKVRNICVIAPPTSQFNTSVSSGCSPLTVSLNNTTTGPSCNGSNVPLGYTWTITTPSGTSASYTSSSLQNPPSVILTNPTSSPQQYTITLTVNPKEPANSTQNFANPNCFTTSSQTVVVNPLPVFIPANVTSCNSPYQSSINLQASTNMSSTFSWTPIDNANITGESNGAQNTSTINDLLTNTSTSPQVVNYTVTPTSTLNCVGNSQTASISINVINPGIISTDQTICVGGDPALLNGTSPTGLGTLTYQWQSSSDNSTWTNISGATAANYNPPVTNSTTYFRRIANYTSNNTICNAFSNTVTITVNSISSGTISSIQNLCSNEDPNILTFSTPSSSQGTLTYQWQSSPNNSSWSNIIGQTGISYDPPVLSSTTHYRVTVFSSLNNVSCSQNTGSIAVNIFNLNPGTISSNQSICTGGDPALLNSTLAATAAGTTINYQWQMSLDNNTWVDIPNATSITYNPPVLTATTYYRRSVSASINGVLICQGNTSPVIITVVADPTVSGPIISQDICTGGTPSTISVVANGGVGTTYSYQWYNSNGIISNANSASYNPPSVNQSYYCIINQVSSGCSVTSGNSIVNILADPIVTSPVGGNYCQGAGNANALSVTASGGISSNYNYQWFSNVNNSTTNSTQIIGANNSSYLPPTNNVGTLYYYCVVTISPNSTGCSVSSVPAMVSIAAGPSINPQPNNQTLCLGGTINNLTVGYTGGTSIPTYQWYSNTVNSATGGTAIANETTSTLSLPSSLNTTVGQNFYYCVLDFGNAGGCSIATSNVAVINVVDDPSFSVQPIASQSVCQGGNINPLSVSVIGGNGSISYQWYTVSGTNYTPISNNGTSSAFTPSTFGTIGTFEFAVKVTQSSSGCSSDYSSIAQVNVISDPVVTTPIGASYCQGTSSVTPLSVTATGGINTNYSYQWYNGSNQISGATTSSYTPPTNNVGTSNYSCTVSILPLSSGCTSNSTSATIIITSAPSFNLQPISQTICLGGSFNTLTVNHTGGSTIPTYQWYSSSTNNNTTGTAIAGQTNASFTPPATSIGTIYYYCALDFGNVGGCSVIVSDLAQISVVSGPVFSTPPLASQSICSGGSISPLNFVLTGGNGNQTYQWYSVSNNIYSVIPNATSATYTPPVFSNPGTYNYSVLVQQGSNGCATTYSPLAEVVVVSDPIASNPSNAIYCQNSSNVTSLSVNLSGGISTSYTYQWYTNGTTNSNSGGVAIPGAITSTYTPVVNAVGVTNYYCVITQGLSNSGCSTVSSAATITVNAAPLISTQPVSNQTVCIGGGLSTLSVGLSGGSGQPTYQWYSNNINSTSNSTLLLNQTNASFIPPSATVAGTTYYYCEISFANNSGCSLVTSDIATISIVDDPLFSIQPSQSQTICSGGQISNPLSVQYINGTGTPSYQWYSVSGMNLTAISGATSSNFTPPAQNSAGVYNYVVQLNLSGSGCGQIQSNAAQITVIADPVVSTPVGASYCLNSNTASALTVNASGGVSNNYSYQWYSSSTNSNASGNPIAGANSSSYIPPTSLNGTIYYFCEVSQGVGCSSKSNVAAITITPAPIFQTQPLITQTICVGGSVNPLSVTFTGGSGTPSYQWYSNSLNSTFGGQAINNQNSATYTPSGNIAGTLYYYCVVNFAQSGCSTITSSIGTVDVVPDPIITVQPITTQTICGGGTIPAALTVNHTGGTGSVSYQWYTTQGSSQNMITGANSISYLPPNFSNPGNYNYFLQLSYTGNGCNVAQSQNAEVIVLSDPSVTNPTSASYCNGYSPVQALTVSPSGGISTNFNYQWYSNQTNSNNNGVLLVGETNSTYIPPVTTNGNVYYYCEVSQGLANSGCMVSSSTALISVYGSPQLSQHPIPFQEACIGGTTTNLSVTYSGGNGTPAYQWYSNAQNLSSGGTPIPGATLANYLPPNNSSGTNYYYCIINFPSLTCGTINSNIGEVIIHSDPIISSQPVSTQSICFGTTIAAPLDVNYTGGYGTPSYQWNLINSNVYSSITGATNSTYLPPIFNVSDTFQYNVTVTLSGNGCNAMTSSLAQIIVSPIPIVDSLGSYLYCNADTSDLVTFSGPISGTTFIWENSNPAIGLDSAGIGDIMPFMLTNMSSLGISGIITVTPQLILTNNTCNGAPISFMIAVNPYQNVNDPQDVVLCHGTGFNGIQFSGTALINNWTNDQPALGIPNAGSGTLPAFLAINNGSYPIIANLSVTPSFNAITTCPGDIETFTITILPAPTVVAPLDQTVCSGSFSSTLNFSGTATSFSWSNNTPSIGLSSSGTGSIPAFITSASGSNSIATIGITPLYSSGNLVCSGQEEFTQITVVAAPTISPIQDLTYCNGEATGNILIQGNANQINWNASNNGIGLTTSGTGTINNFNAINSSQNPVSSVITMIPINYFGGLTCTSPAQTFTITVNPTPTMTPIVDQYLCAQTNTQPVIFTGNASSYTWANSNPNIGLGSTGNGNIAAFTTINNSASIITSNITVIPYFTYAGKTCSGNQELFELNILPTPILNSISSLTVCSGTSTTPIIFSGNATNYSWINNNSSIGLDSIGTGNISSFIANSQASSQIANITVTPQIIYNNLTCSGTPQNTTITVIAEPTVFTPNDIAYCHSVNAGNINLSGNATNYTWNNNNPSIGLAATGSGLIPTFITQNNGTNPIVAPIEILPSISLNNQTCFGNLSTFNITVNPNPTLNSVSNQVICHSTNTLPIDFTGNATNFIWTNSNPTIGLSNSGSGDILPFQATNFGNTNNISNIQVIAQYNNAGAICNGDTLIFSMTVEPIPVVQYSSLSQNICSGIGSNTIQITSSTPGVNYQWFITNPTTNLSGIGPINGINDIPSMMLINTSTTNAQLNFYGQAITPLAGCIGTGGIGSIIVNPEPLMNNINDTTLCNDSLVYQLLTASIPSNFTWSAVNNPNVQGETFNLTNSNVIFNTLQNTSNSIQYIDYTITPTSIPTSSNPGGCIGTSLDFTVELIPDITVTSLLDTAICSGEQTAIALTTNIPASIVWHAIDNNSVSGETTGPNNGFYINDVLSNSTLYNQVVNYSIDMISSPYGCFGIPEIINVTVYPDVLLNMPNPVTICSTDTLNLNLSATVNANFTWYATNNGNVSGESTSLQSNPILSDVLVNNTNNIEQVNYTVSATSTLNGCSSIDLPLVVLVKPLPIVLNNDTIICSNQYTDINISTSIPSNIIWNGIFNTSIQGETTSSIQNNFLNDFLINNSGNLDTLIYLISATANGCTAPTDSLLVAVYDLPDVDFAVLTTPLCSENNVVFDNLSSINYSSSWDFGDGGISNQFEPSYIYQTPGIYEVFLTVTDPSNECIATDSLDLNILKTPDASFYTLDTIGCDNLNATFYANYQANTSMVWDFGNGTIINQVGNTTNYYDQAGCYDVTLTVTSDQGCIAQESYIDYICLYDSPVAIISADPLTVNAINPNIQFYNSSQNSISYVWNMGDGNISYDDNPNYTYAEEAADYNVILTAVNQAGCIDTASIGIHVFEDIIIYAPNTFTPNNDESNQVFLPILSQGVKKSYFELTIFNRWGEVVFVSNDPNIGWDGTYGMNGIDCQNGTYTWKLKVEVLQTEEIKDIHGHVNLIR